MYARRPPPVRSPPWACDVPAFLHPFAKPTRESFIPNRARRRRTRLGCPTARSSSTAWPACGTAPLGHGRAEMAEAIARQRVRWAPTPASIRSPTSLPRALQPSWTGSRRSPTSRVFFCSLGHRGDRLGHEAVPPRGRFAGQPQRTLIISRIRGYHGTAYGGTSAQGIAPQQGALRSARRRRRPGSGRRRRGAGDSHGRVRQRDRRRPHRAGAGRCRHFSAGRPVPPGRSGLCDQHGAYLIFDEVITGFGRLGTWFAAHHFDVAPDLVTFAKAVTSGYQPLGGVFVGPCRGPLEADPDFVLRNGFTYSGHPDGGAAGDWRNLQIILDEAPGRAGRPTWETTAGVCARSPRTARSTMSAARAPVGHRPAPRPGCDGLPRSHHARGVIARAINADTMTFCPPLVATDEQIDRIVDVFSEVASG